MTETLVEIDGVRLAYAGGTLALDGLDLAVRPGEFAAVVDRPAAANRR